MTIRSLEVLGGEILQAVRSQAGLAIGITKKLTQNTDSWALPAIRPRARGGALEPLFYPRPVTLQPLVSWNPQGAGRETSSTAFSSPGRGPGCDPREANFFIIQGTQSWETGLPFADRGGEPRFVHKRTPRGAMAWSGRAQRPARPGEARGTLPAAAPDPGPVSPASRRPRAGDSELGDGNESRIYPSRVV